MSIPLKSRVDASSSERSGHDAFSFLTNTKPSTALHRPDKISDAVLSRLLSEFNNSPAIQVRIALHKPMVAKAIF